MAKIAVFIKTCHGRTSLVWVLKSIEYSLKDVDFRLYISDEEPLNEWKRDLYEELYKQGHHIEIHNSGISCGKARNNLLKKLEDEEFILRLDDDFELGGEFNFSALYKVVNSSDEIGFCSDFEMQVGNNKSVFSGSIRPAGGEFVVSQPKLIKKYHSPFKRYKNESDIRYSLADHTRNLLLIKREVVERVRWNEKLLFRGEHEEFMLSVKEAGYRGAYTPDSIHYHRDDLTNFRTGSNNSIERPGMKQLREVFKEKWGCNKIVTKYPISWYVIEGVRSVLSKSILL